MKSESFEKKEEGISTEEQIKKYYRLPQVRGTKKIENY